MTPLPIQIEVLPEAHGLLTPHYTSEGAASLGLYCADSVELTPFWPVRVPLGIKIGLPRGLVAHVLSTPELASQGVNTLHEVWGADDRGALKVQLTWLAPPFPGRNLDPRLKIPCGHMVALLSLAPMCRVKMHQVKALSSGPGAPLPQTA